MLENLKAIDEELNNSHENRNKFAQVLTKFGVNFDVVDNQIVISEYSAAAINAYKEYAKKLNLNFKIIID